MRPLKLTMSAFGPYSSVEIIDFDELQSRNLFLITGPTGSGKTTIFDAISYALYGKASGELRTEETLRSHFSESDLLTEVTLVFELNQMTYTVHRIPKQMRPKARTEGLTEQKPEAILTIEQGEVIKVIAGVSKVNRQIEQILGINEEQFKQIMMIPQGEFRKLLTSDSQEREKVLQQLFDTYAYRKVQIELNEKAKLLGGAIKREKVARDTLITQIKPGQDLILESLIEAEDKFVDKIQIQTQALIDFDQSKEKALAQDILVMDEQIKKVIKAQNKASEDNQNLVLKAETEEAIKVQEARQAIMTEVQVTVTKGEAAARLVGAEHHIINREREISKRELEEKACLKKITELGESYQVADQALKELTSEKSKKENNKRLVELADYESYIVKVSGLQQLERRVQEKKSSLEALKKAIEHNKSQKIKSETQIKQFNLKIESLKDVPVQLERLKGEHQKAVIHQKQLEKALTTLEKLRSVASKQSMCETKAKSMASSLKLVTKDYKEAQLTFLLNQAAILSKELKTNEPCPVCGSTKHPSPAESNIEMVTKEQLDHLEIDVNSAKSNHDEALKELAIQNERYTNYITGFKGLLEELFGQKTEAMMGETLTEQRTIVEEAHKVSENRLSLMFKDLDALVIQQETIEVIKGRLDKGIVYMASIDEELKEQNDDYVIAIARHTKLKSDLEHVYEELPEGLRQLKVLEGKISKCKKTINDYNEACQKARKHYEDVNDQRTKEIAKNQQLVLFIKEEKSSIASLWQTFQEQVVTSGFVDLEAYKLSKIEQEKLLALQDELYIYNQGMDRLRESLKTYVQKTQGLNYRDMAEFETRIKEQQAHRQVAIEDQGEVKARIRDNKVVLTSITEMNDLIKDKESTYNVVGKLARIAQGNNPAMMTFERYVLAAFLEDILLAANIRLRQMTQGRYILSRSSELQRKNKQSGLELEVFDNFTGRSRHVKTLSGGEGFKASLSMALGLSDVVQSYAGGVRLDTMFIDEGFGTLDQESLDSAIDCLIDLQKAGRLVGIISHVQELKERIDTRLEIRSSNTGSETRFVLG